MNRFRCLLAAFGIAMAMGAGVAQASYTLYDNTATFSGNVYAGGGASGIGTVSTAMFADDITVASNPTGYAVNSISFSLGNLNSTSASAAPTIYIYAADPSTFGPGALVTSITFAPITLASDTETVFTYTSTSTLFTVPGSAQPGGSIGLFWAGISFSNAGTTTTADQLNNFGMGLFNPPDVGSSQDAFFQSTSASTNGSNLPAGGFEYFGGSPAANFGWAFGSSVPEPSSLVLTSLAGVVLVLGRSRVAGLARRLAS